jgi:protein-tyrosine phosphatase
VVNDSGGFQLQTKYWIAMNILFVCLGNICRSPMAEGILKKLYRDHNIKGVVESAGFESFHINDHPDKRSIQVARKHGIDISKKQARLFRKEDFDVFDRIYVMDALNMSDVSEIANEEQMKKVDYLMNVLEPGSNKVIPDPFTSGIEDCEKVFQLMESACQKLLDEVKH